MLTILFFHNSLSFLLSIYNCFKFNNIELNKILFLAVLSHALELCFLKQMHREMLSLVVRF